MQSWTRRLLFRNDGHFFAVSKNLIFVTCLHSSTFPCFELMMDNLIQKSKTFSSKQIVVFLLSSFVTFLIAVCFITNLEWISTRPADHFHLSNDYVGNLIMTDNNTGRNISSTHGTLNISQFQHLYVWFPQSQRKTLFEGPLIVHYVRLYTVTAPTSEKNSLSFLSCLLSVMQKLETQRHLSTHELC